MKAKYLLEAIAAMQAAERLSYTTPPAEFGRVMADLTAARHSLLAYSGLYQIDIPIRQPAEFESLQSAAAEAQAALNRAVWRDDKLSERTDMHISTEPGDLDTFGRPLQPGS